MISPALVTNLRQKQYMLLFASNAVLFSNRRWNKVALHKYPVVLMNNDMFKMAQLESGE